MRWLLSCIGRRGYVAHQLRAHLASGDRIIGTSNTPWTPGFAACDRAVLMPDIQDPGYAESVLELCRSERVDALLSFFDLDVDLLSERREALRAAGTVPILPSPEVSQLALDKSRTPGFLARAGLNASPAFCDLHAANAALAEGSLKFPAVVKPRFGFASRHLFVARTPGELETFFAYEPDMMIQQWFSGPEYHLDVLNDLEGRVVAVVPKRKTAMRAGETDQAVTVEAPELLELGERLGAALGRLGHVGPLDVDLFLVEGEPFVLELNPRFGGGYPLSQLAGADFPGLLVRMVRGEPVAPCIGDYERDVVLMKDHALLGGKRAEFVAGLVDRRGEPA